MKKEIDQTTIDAFKQLWAEKQKAQPHSGTCPNCGYCPHCGRGQQMQPLYPVYPQPNPYWQIPPYQTPYWYGNSGTITCGTSPVSGNIGTLNTGQFSYASGTCSQS